MKPQLRLFLFGLVLASVFVAAFAVGRVVGPFDGSDAEAAAHGAAADVGSGLPGLAATSGGLTLVPSVDTVAPDTSTPYSFRIMDENGDSVTEFELEQTKRMHLIVVRRDFVGFVHDHPSMDATGKWSTTLRVATPGVYRVFADFIVDGEKHTLGTDLFVPGDFRPTELPSPTRSASTDGGYAVELVGDIVAEEASHLSFTVRKDGRRIAQLADYLGAKGHLVALRDGDLAYLHVHPEQDRLVFEATFPNAGNYRLFLQFRHDGQVRTVSHTVNVRDAA